MGKKIKMVLYGEPGVGKSVFASKAPKPFFITTDGNYEWLEDFGAKPEDHIEVHSWSEAKKVFKSDFSNYETLVIDLTEDLFKWCEYEYCSRNKLEHISDVGFGKGYDSTRTEFFIEMCKLIALDMHIIFIMHGVTFTVKDRRGVEHTHYGPSPRIPDKVLDMLEGRVRYFLRCYLKADVTDDGRVIKKRYLSLVPKENEFGIHRGVDENTMPQDIELDFETFAKYINLDTTTKTHKVVANMNVINDTAVNNELDFSIKNSVESEIKDDIKENFANNEEPTQELTQAQRIEAIKAKLAAKKQQN